MKRVCVFCGSSPGNRPDFAEAATRLATALVERDLELVYGGAKVGLMGILANAVLDRGGRVHGVIPELLKKKELVHEGLTELFVVGSMHERKAKMAELSDGFVSLPGGLGTWEETFEMLTWTQLGIHNKPCGLLNVGGYFAPIVELFERGLAEGFLREEQMGLLLVDDTAAGLLSQMEVYTPPPRHKWLDPEQSSSPRVLRKRAEFRQYARDGDAARKHGLGLSRPMDPGTGGMRPQDDPT